MNGEENLAMNSNTSQVSPTALNAAESSQLVTELDNRHTLLDHIQEVSGPTEINGETVLPLHSASGTDFSFSAIDLETFNLEDNQFFALPGDGMDDANVYCHVDFENGHHNFETNNNPTGLDSVHLEQLPGFDNHVYHPTTECGQPPTVSSDRPAEMSPEPATRLPRTRLESSEDLSDDELTMKLTSRYTSLKIADNGQLRYYGVTSNLHMLGDQLSSLFQPTIRSTRHDADEVITQAGLDWDRDSEYEDRLFNLYFAWHDPLMQEVPKTLFFQSRKAYHLGEDVSFYSPALENAM